MTGRLSLAALLVIVASSVFASAALGHAKLVSSNPPDGGTLTTTPFTLTATFDEELTADGSSLVIVDASGAQVATGSLSDSDDKTLNADLPELRQGEYEARWTAVTADDQAVERGTFKFHVGGAGGTLAPTPLATPAASQGTGSGGGNDLLIALVLVAAVVAGVLAYLFLRSRR